MKPNAKYVGLTPHEYQEAPDHFVKFTPPPADPGPPAGPPLLVVALYTVLQALVILGLVGAVLYVLVGLAGG